MQIYGMNRHGGKSNSDIIIHASGEGINELEMFCDAALKENIHTDYVKNSTCDRVVKIATELRKMMHPLNDDPKRIFTTT